MLIEEKTVFVHDARMLPRPSLDREGYALMNHQTEGDHRNRLESA